MKEWYESLAVRERRFVLAAAAVAAIAVFYLAVWMPLDHGQQRAAASVENWTESLAELRLLKGALKAEGAPRGTPVDPSQSLVVIVDKTLRARDLYSSLQRSQPTDTHGIRVEFEDAAFDGLVLWLGDLNTSYGLRVQAGSFSAPSKTNSGRVDAVLTLER